MGIEQYSCDISPLIKIGSTVMALCVACFSGSSSQAHSPNQVFDRSCDPRVSSCDDQGIPLWSRPAEWFEAAQADASLYPATSSSQTSDTTCCCAEPRPRRGQWLGGFEFLWMRANFDQNVALIIDPPVGNTLVPFEYGRKLSTRSWLGWQSARGGGFQATYWEFDEQAADESVTAVVGATPVFVYVYGAGNNLSRNAQAGVGETLTARHRLKLQSLDLEATQQFDLNFPSGMSSGMFKGTLSGGLRIAEMDQHLRGDVVDGLGALQESVSNDLKFQGAGPTVALKINRAIAASRFAIYGGLRGSMLMGETKQKIYEMKGAFTTELEDRATQREIITALEMALGLQWNQPIGHRCNTFARAGYECQTWLDAGGPVDSHSTISLDAITLALGLQY